MRKPKLRRAARELIEKHGSLADTPDEELESIKKRCTDCRNRKPLNQFHRYSGRSTDGFRPICKECRRAKERARQQARRAEVTHD